MPDNLKNIAKRIKELREINGISPETLAKEVNVNPDLLKKYENGEADIPVGFLHQIAEKFGVELTSLITGGEPRLHTYCVVRKDRAPQIDRRKEYKYRDLAYNFINKQAEVFLVTVEPDSNKPHEYAHKGQEFNFVLEGKLKIFLDGHEIILEEGDSLYFDSGKNHGMQAMDGKNAKFIAVII